MPISESESQAEVKNDQARVIATFEAEIEASVEASEMNENVGVEMNKVQLEETVEFEEDEKLLA